ncbi:MAG: YciI family protein [Thermoleophilia bacterium]
MPHFLVLSRGAPAAGTTDDPGLDEAHWSYMDRFAPGMIARGPTLTADRGTWTGSMHVVELADAAAARVFAEEEPYNRAGLYAHHRIWGYRDLLGRTMWEFARTPGMPLFLVIAAGSRCDGPDPAGALGAGLLLCGELAAIDGGDPPGFALALQAPHGIAAEAALRAAGVDGVADPHVEILDWEVGGRR